MNRIIKFRALKDDISNFNFVYGSLIYDKQGNPRITEDNGNTYHTCKKSTVGQFTGLKDCKGVDIYEGDLCTVTNPYNGKTAIGSSIVILSYEYVGGWVLTSDGKDRLNISSRTNSIEVIGNIHNK